MINNRPVIVIPIYRAVLDPAEQIALKQCARILSAYPIALTGPQGLDLSAYQKILGEVSWEPFPGERFADISTYSRLLLSPEFYRRFDRYEFLLLYQTDAYIFRDELSDWCNRDLDYVGAPFLPRQQADADNLSAWVGGNGGFSLRRISAFLNVLENCRHLPWKTREELKAEYRSSDRAGTLRGYLGYWFRSRGRTNTIGDLLDHYRWNEDAFWSVEAPRTGQFRIPEVREAARFAIETSPRRWIDQISEELPMGLHAWWRYDFEFWKPHLDVDDPALWDQLINQALRSEESSPSPHPQQKHKT